MYVERLKIENFRNIRETEFELNYPGKENGASSLPNVNLFLGDNASGKSSVFKALALAIRGSELAYSGFIGEFLVRRVPEIYDDAQLNLAVLTGTSLDRDSIGPERQLVSQNLETLIIAREDGDRIEFQAPISRGLIIGYGANRRASSKVNEDKIRTRPYQRIASLFEDDADLVNVEYGWLQLGKFKNNEGVDRINEASAILNSLLPLEFRMSSVYNPRVPRMFNRGTIDIPFNGLSDGLRVFTSWVWDMLVHLAHEAQPNERLVDVRGLVIVDEIDLLLHPEWQRVVIPKVAKAFPNIQFCFSTHSPLVAGTVEKENLYVMETETDGAAVVRQYREDIHGLTPNQILTSSYFGLASVRAPGTGTLADLAKKMANGNGNYPDPEIPTPDPAFNQWLDGVLKKEAEPATKPKRTRRKKTSQD